MTQHMNADGEERKFQDSYPSFTERASQFHPSFSELAGEKIAQKRPSLAPSWIFALALLSIILIVFLTYVVLTGLTEFMDPLVIEGQLIGLGMVVFAIMVINVIFNLKHSGYHLPFHELAGEKIAQKRSSPGWLLALALLSILSVAFLTYIILQSFTYAPELTMYKLIGLGMVVVSITVINLIFNPKRSSESVATSHL